MFLSRMRFRVAQLSRLDVGPKEARSIDPPVLRQSQAGPPRDRVHRRQVLRRSLQSRPSRQRASSTFSGKDNLNKRFNFTNQLTIQHDTSI
jgi:hypothetical protein